MPTVLQLRRGTTAQNDAFTGSAGELTFNTTNGALRAHDGTTAGGAEMLINDGSNADISQSVTLTGAVSGSATITNLGNLSITTTATSDPTITLAGDLTGSVTLTNLGNGTLTATVVDDSHNHIISNVDGLQTALDAKQAAATALTTSTSFGGDVSGTYNAIVVADDSHNHIISNVDGLQTALDAKAALSGATFTGDVSGTNLTLSGNLTVNGTTTTVATTNTVVSDNLIELNNGAASNANDSGIVIERGSTGDNAFIGWDESADQFIVGTTTATGSSTGDLTITAAKLTVATPTAASDAATKGYIDTAISSLSSNSISEGNTSITVTDSGTGSIVAAVDGSTHTTFNSSGITISTGNFVGNLTGNASGSSSSCTGNAATATTATNVTATANNLTNETTYITFVDGATGAQGIETDTGLTYNPSTGNLTSTLFTGTATSARYADLAEKYSADAEYAPGTVLQFGGESEVTVSKQFATRKVAGVVSTDPAYMMNSEAEGVYVALTGRVPCRVIGVVEKGDLMVASNTPGCAVAWGEELRDPPAGSIIGKALENKSGQEEGTIEVVVGVR